MFHKWFWVDFRKGAASQTAEKSASSLDLYGVLTLRTKLVNRVISLTLTKHPHAVLLHAIRALGLRVLGSATLIADPTGTRCGPLLRRR